MPRAVYLLALANCVFSCCGMVFNMTLSSFVVETGIGTTAVAGTAGSVQTFVGFVVGLLFARIIKRLGRFVPAFALASLAVCYFGLSQATTPLAVYASIAFIGLCCGILYPYLNESVARVTSASQVTLGMSYVSMGMLIGNFLCGFFVTFLTQISEDPTRPSSSSSAPGRSSPPGSRFSSASSATRRHRQAALQRGQARLARRPERQKRGRPAKHGAPLRFKPAQNRPHHLPRQTRRHDAAASGRRAENRSARLSSLRFSCWRAATASFPHAFLLSVFMIANRTPTNAMSAAQTTTGKLVEAPAPIPCRIPHPERGQEVAEIRGEHDEGSGPGKPRAFVTNPISKLTRKLTVHPMPTSTMPRTNIHTEVPNAMQNSPSRGNEEEHARGELPRTP